ncbi:MAG: T9SS type A sorting domain-containing protein [Prevotella sp.]|nr:T9SS type A sorting domain-containing protein [Prevotella sp.]
MKKILAIAFASLLAFGVPTVSFANVAIEIIEQEFQNVTISVNQSVVRVSGANGQVMHVYNVAGVRLMTIRIDGNDKSFELNLPKGCYIVKIGKTVRKISIK